MRLFPHTGISGKGSRPHATGDACRPWHVMVQRSGSSPACSSLLCSGPGVLTWEFLFPRAQGPRVPALAVGNKLKLLMVSLLGHQLFPESMGNKVFPSWPVPDKNPYFKPKLEFPISPEIVHWQEDTDLPGEPRGARGAMPLSSGTWIHLGPGVTLGMGGSSTWIHPDQGGSRGMGSSKTWLHPVPPGCHGAGKVRGRCDKRQHGQVGLCQPRWAREVLGQGGAVATGMVWASTGHTACATTLCHLSLLHPRTMGLRSVTILLGTALLLLAPGSTQALSSSRWKDLATEQDLAEESILGVGAPEEGEPGIKVFSSSAWAQRGPPQVQARPEEDRDHLYRPQDDGREASARVPFWMPVPKVQNGPEEDRDHLYHPQDNAREVNARMPFWMLAPEVQNGPEEDLDYIHHG
ncbi:proline-rich acidic protein 1 isoform X1 [Pyrgilauda ruficollis]|uniref:proline-rich acidic protein 1 isoform X1 n=2 Tax=Pyrgilauda ruficollis TaxID=221976 RepID=UPI001B884F99|nr:proline-rich acidic protein 1 isoform X1 [Pyrgilauda ruficollis]